MNISEARAAIEAILEAIPDDDLPEFDRVEIEADNRVCVWWGGHGHVLGTAKRDGKRRPLNYRENGSWAAIESEMTHRTDRRFLENGDNPKGIRLGKKKVSA